MSEKFTPLDILAFAKAGWKPADVKEVIALSEAKNEAEEPKEPAPESVQQPEEVNAAETPVQSEEKEVPDYKAMFEEQQKQIEALQGDLKKAQSLNVTQNVAPAEPKLSRQEVVNNIFREVIF